ncbi:hypothetical protein [Enterobacter cancerogenus]|uniref:hypothetical protein n=1 Tax=Enterobacter cancerogenus TaxID=69218 RepID=UPI00053770D1|nr:hypothetical protein [Enterobacter cancerogenus]KGT88073.1 hypothetical protein NH00_20125 [Enterobacter cancerogenus]
MIKTHRLSVYLNNNLVGNLDCESHQADALITKIQNALSAEEGWSTVRWVSDQEKRILESSPAGIKLISSEKLFRQA